jgi:hypothetical protein
MIDRIVVGVTSLFADLACYPRWSRSHNPPHNYSTNIGSFARCNLYIMQRKVILLVSKINLITIYNLNELVNRLD